MTVSQPEHLTGGQLNSALANAIVRLHSRHVGRGPTKARAFYRHNVVVLLLEGALTRAEKSLVDDDRGALALTMRRRFHEVMRADLVEAVERLTGHAVVAFLSTSHLDPDVVGQVFILGRSVSGEDEPAAAA
jgi:uncharacterized protein YbcI